MSHRTIYEDIRSVISLLESASGPMRFVKRDGPTTAPSGPDHALASLSAAQASEKGLLTSGTFGHTGFTSSRSAALATSLENRLRAKTDGLGSTLYKLTWKHWDLPSGRQICALRASVRRTSGKDSGSMGDQVRQDTSLTLNGVSTTSLSPWPKPATTDHKGGYLGGRIRNGKWSTDRLDVTAQLSGWATPVANPANGTPEAFLERKRKSIERGSKMGVSLSDLQMQAIHNLSGWGTPSATDDNNSRMGEEAMAREWARPGGSKSSLAKQAAVLSGWPTTSCSNDRAARPAIMKREDGTKNQQRLQDLAALSGWPTPNASNGSGGGQAKRFTNPERSNELNDCVMLTGWATSDMSREGKIGEIHSGSGAERKGGVSTRMADDTSGGRRQDRQDNRRCDEGDRTQGLAARPTGERSNNTACPTNGFWRDADWLGCRDGKFRPVEPGTSPLVNGAAARVGRLRGYGNAIVAQVAQTFIEATQGW